jgi:hypothetical protein
MIQYDFQRIPCLPWNKYKFRITIDILILINKIKKNKMSRVVYYKKCTKNHVLYAVIQTDRKIKGTKLQYCISLKYMCITKNSSYLVFGFSANLSRPHLSHTSQE